MTHRASLLGRGYQDYHLDSPRVRFRRALLLCLMTVIVPGSGHIAVGRRAGLCALFGVMSAVHYSGGEHSRLTQFVI